MRPTAHSRMRPFALTRKIEGTTTVLMAIKIAPALSLEEWDAFSSADEETATASLQARLADLFGDAPLDSAQAQAGAAALVAISNDVMSDNDPRKIKRFYVDRIREAADVLDDRPGPFNTDHLRMIADVLESLLPPE